MSNVGFIGVGYMGYGIAKNILEKGNNLFVVANKNRKPIEKIVSKGAIEIKSFEDFSNKQLNVLVKCVTNTPIAKEIATKLASILDEKTLIIDITTHNQSGSIETEKIYQSKNINYIECPVMGGPVQAEEGVLGGIVGATDNNFQVSRTNIKTFL
jgi:3-hydroxyisobutyrate dehydrogenase-like beta-hydroxyacid dehydrogenase